MAEYTKNVWADGDTITAEKLNNIENGIEENKAKFYNIDSLPATIDTDLTVEDFINAYVVISNMGWSMCLSAQLNNGYISLFSGQGVTYYIPSTGLLTQDQPK